MCHAHQRSGVVIGGAIVAQWRSFPLQSSQQPVPIAITLYLPVPDLLAKTLISISLAKTIEQQLGWPTQFQSTLKV